MSRSKDQFHSEIIANSADAEWERALDESLAEQYPNYGEKGKSLELHQVEVKAPICPGGRCALSDLPPLGFSDFFASTKAEVHNDRRGTKDSGPTVPTVPRKAGARAEGRDVQNGDRAASRGNKRMTSFKDIYKREPIRDRNFVMPFGKYLGTPLHEIIKHDPQYIIWLQNGDGIEFHSDIMDEVEGNDVDQRFRREVLKSVGKLSDFID